MPADSYNHSTRTLLWATYLLTIALSQNAECFKPGPKAVSSLTPRLKRLSEQNDDGRHHHKVRGLFSNTPPEEKSNLQGNLQQKIGLSAEVAGMDNAQITRYDDDLKIGTPAPQVKVDNEETFPFQAEVSRVMDIIVNSLYTDKDVFLREMVSNAADALDKRRIQADPEDKMPKETFGGIRIIPNKEHNTLTIEDDGIGMTHAELVKNLGTIAESGTAKFLKQVC